MTPDEILHLPPPMDRTAIPEEEYEPAEMFEHATEEGLHLRAGDIARVKIDEQSHALTFRRNGNRGDSGNSIAPIAMAMNRCFARGCPGLSNIGNEQKSALIKKSEMGPKFLSFFLYVAIFSLSNVQWQLRPAEWHDAPVFASSIPCFLVMVRYSRDDRRHPSDA